MAINVKYTWSQPLTRIEATKITSRDQLAREVLKKLSKEYPIENNSQNLQIVKNCIEDDDNDTYLEINLEKLKSTGLVPDDKEGIAPKLLRDSDEQEFALRIFFPEITSGDQVPARPEIKDPQHDHQLWEVVARFDSMSNHDTDEIIDELGTYLNDHFVHVQLDGHPESSCAAIITLETSTYDFSQATTATGPKARIDCDGFVQIAYHAITSVNDSHGQPRFSAKILGLGRKNKRAGHVILEITEISTGQIFIVNNQYVVGVESTEVYLGEYYGGYSAEKPQTLEEFHQEKVF
ncbi:MAG: hypothetical protein ABH823_01765 [bacterium]